MSVSTGVKRYLPKSLLGRSLLIIVTPLVLLQVVSAVIFYETHWNKVAFRLAQGVAGDIAAVIGLMRTFPGPENQEWIFDLASDTFGLAVTLTPGKILTNSRSVDESQLGQTLTRALELQVFKPFRLDTETRRRHVLIDVQLPEGRLRAVTPRKRLFSSTVYVFVLWMVGISLVLFGVATVFMRNQVKPIRRLALAADDFGKGREIGDFKPEGAREVRQAATAFQAMRNRIRRQISQRTDMLSGVSHDLRTPLTRMKLQLAMLPKTDGAQHLEDDISEMERMLEGYLAFARGEGTEKPKPTQLGPLLEEAVAQGRRKGGAVDLHLEDDFVTQLRPDAFRRCITNLVDNAVRHGDHVSVRAGQRDDAIEITVDDDGPGIPEERRDDVFRPFVRLEESRNQDTGGVGLGLAIVRDVVRSHGGEIALSDAPRGGLRARIRVPI